MEFLTIESHDTSLGTIDWDPASVSLYLSPQQESGVIEGRKLRKELLGKSVLNAAVLDWLIKHQDQIPDEWKDEDIICFWGTIYRDGHDELCVRYLSWRDGEWDWFYYRLAIGFDSDQSAALFESARKSDI